MKRRLIALILVFAISVGLVPTTVAATEAVDNTAPLAPTNLRVELSREPLGVESEYPLLSWVVEDADINEVQSAYRVLVATDKSLLNEGKADVWDSGKVFSSENTNVRYAGTALTADSIFYWTVKTWDKNDAESPYAEAQFFSTAVKNNWDAEAIWYEANDAELFEKVGLSDYILEADCTIVDTALGFVVRKPTNSAVEDYGCMVQLRAGTGTQPVLKIQSLGENGYASEIKASQCGVSIETGKTYALKISVIGDVLKVWIDGTLVVERSGFIEDTTGTFGVRCGNFESGYVDNLKITGEDGSLYLKNDFADGKESPFANGGTLESGRLMVGKGQKLYHVVQYIADPSGWEDYTMECDFSITTNALGFIVRKSDISTADNGYLVQVRVGSGSQVMLKTQTLPVTDGITKEVKASTSGVGIEAGKKYHLKITVVGNDLNIWIDGIQVESRAGVLKNEVGTVGIRCGNTESGSVDNVEVLRPDGLVYLSSDFSNKNIFTNGGKLSAGELLVEKGKKIYYLEKGDWTEEKGNAIFLRKEFTISKPVEKAIVSAIAKSRTETMQYVFKMYVNGSFAGLGSPWPLKASQSTYNTYDITSLLQNGDNCIGVTAYALSDKRFQARLKLFYEDGTTEVISTDETWQAMDGTATFGDYGGSVGSALYELMQENIDARVYPFGYAQPGYDAADWKPALVKTPITSIAASQVENIKEFTMGVEKIVNKGNGNYFMQLEKEIVGGLRLRIPNGVAGTQLTLRYGEELSGENTVKWEMRTGNVYQEIWTLKDGEQIIENWGMRNIRYIEILNCPFTLTADMVEGIALRQEFDDSEAYLKSTDPLLDEIFEFMKYSIKATNQDMYVDSQVRERGRADGDIYINQLTSFAVSSNYTLSHQTNEYALFGRSVWAEYNKVIIINAWNEYLHTGDKQLLEKYYAPMVVLLNLDGHDEQTGLYRDSYKVLVDWPVTERDNYNVDGIWYNTVVNAFQYKALLTMKDVAMLLGKPDDAQLYADKAAELKYAVNSYFFDVNGNGLYIEGMRQDGSLSTGNAIHASLYPYLFGMADNEAAQEQLGEYLAEKGLVGSVYFSQFYLEALYENGQADAAMDVLTGTGTKSWYHMMYDLNATISCEAWDPSIKPNMTYSHPWGAAAGNIIVRQTFGIQPLEAGYGRIQIKPQLGLLEYATLKTPTIKGSITVTVDQTTDNALFSMTVTTPANTYAKVYVPACGSGSNVVLVDGVAVCATREGDFLVLDNVGSGEHSFVLPNEQSFVMVCADGSEFTTTDPIKEWETGEYTCIKLVANSIICDLQGHTVTVDLNGCDLTVGGDGKLIAYDSSNDSYDAIACGKIVNAGQIEIQKNVTTSNGNCYIAVSHNDGITMHRLDIGISAVAVRPSIDGVYYTATFHCDNVLQQEIQMQGVAVSLVDLPGDDFETDADTLYAVGKNGVMISNIIKGDAEDADRAIMDIYAAAFVKLKDGTILTSDEVVAYSFYDVLMIMKTQNPAAYKSYIQKWQ